MNLDLERESELLPLSLLANEGRS